MTLAEFSNCLRRLHCIDGWQLPETWPPGAIDSFLNDPVHYFLRCDDEKQQVIWDAMEEDAKRFAAARRAREEVEQPPQTDI